MASGLPFACVVLAISGAMKSGSFNLDHAAFTVKILGHTLNARAQRLPSDGTSFHPVRYMTSLAEQMISHLAIGVGEEERQCEIIRKAISRLMDAPTAREIAIDYLAESIPTTVQFGKPKNATSASSDYMLLIQPRDYAHWEANRLVVILNAAYLTADEGFRATDLPVLLGHELFGHGIWYARAERAGVRQGYHHHELNETNARLVGWLINLELNGPGDCGEAIRYLDNAAQYLAHMKLKLPYYALTFSSQEMLRPVEVMEAGAQQARNSRSALVKRLAELGALMAAEDGKGRRDTSDSPACKARDPVQAEEKMWIRNELTSLDAVITELDAVIGRFRAETENKSERYLCWASEHSFFVELQREVDKRSNRLRRLLSTHMPSPAPEPRA